MGGKGNITRSLPTNQYLAALKANNPSKTNVFVTMLDLTTSIGGLTLDEVLKKGNRAVSKPISIARNNKLGFGDDGDKDDPINYIALDDQGNLDVYVDAGLVQFLNNAFYVGDSQTNNHSKIEGTFTAARTQTLPDKDGTFAMLSDVQEGIQASESVLLNTNPAIYADGAQGSIDPAGGVSGWYYKNDGQNKINWYYVVNSSGNAMPLSSIKGMYALIRPVVAMQPYFNIYTQREFDGQDAGTFYRSRITYNTNNVLDAYVGQPVLLYWGEDPDVYTNIPHVEMTKEEFSSVGPQAPSEEVSTGTLSTSSNSTVGLYEFTVSNLGYLYGDERIDHILVAVTEAANNLSFENGLEEDTLTNTVRSGGKLNRNTSLLLEGYNYETTGTGTEEISHIGQQLYRVVTPNGGVVFGGQANFQVTNQNGQIGFLGFDEFLISSANSNIALRGIRYYLDDTLQWNSSTPDEMIPSKGYVDRHNAYTISLGRRGNLNIGNYMRTSANVNMNSTSGAVVGAKSLLVGVSIKIQSNDFPGDNYTIRISVLNTDGTVKRTSYYTINEVGIPYVANLLGTATTVVEMGQMITVQFVNFGATTPVTTLRNAEVSLQFQKIQ